MEFFAMSSKVCHMENKYTKNTSWHGMEYFATSSKVCHVENGYTKNISWHGMEYFQRFFFAQVNTFIFSLELAHPLLSLFLINPLQATNHTKKHYKPLT
jgi:hypothetical protein